MRTDLFRRRLSLEPLEGREVPAALVHTLLSNGTLFITGDAQADTITIAQSPSNSNAGHIVITPGAGTKVDGHTTPVTRSFVGDLVIELGRGSDNLSFDLTRAITLPGSLVIDYGTAGTGDKTTATTNASQFNLRVAHGLGIRYAAGNVRTTLDNLVVVGNAVVQHAAGDSTLTIDNLGGSGHFSSIGGSLTVTNTLGQADTSVLDTNVGRSVTVTNGKGRVSGNAAGSTKIANANNTARATIGGNLSISNLTGDSTSGDTVGDVIVTGNVSLVLGTGAFTAKVADVTATGAPVAINGSLTIKGTAAGRDTITLGAAGTGLAVAKNVTVTTGSQNAAITIDDLAAAGTTTVFTGAGAATIAIDGGNNAKGSMFGGTFTLGTGSGADALTINSGSATAATTDFKAAVSVSLGGGNDSLQVATAGKVKFDTPASKSVVFNGSTGHNTKTVTTANVSGHPQSYLHFS